MWLKIGWLTKFPYILILTWTKKLVHVLSGNVSYERLQKSIYAAPQFSDAFDKFHNLRELICDEVISASPNSVLDVGTGTGWQAAALKARGITRVVGIDLVQERIDYCKSSHATKGIEFIQMDVGRLCFSDKSIDATVVSAMLHDLPTEIRLKSFREMARVTKHRIVIFEPRSFKNPILSAVYGLLGSLVDESADFYSYANANIKNELARARIQIVKEQLVWGKVMSILTCDVIER